MFRIQTVSEILAKFVLDRLQFQKKPLTKAKGLEITRTRD